jgi:4-hydroxybenzoate polyprenyltransferase
MGSFINPGYAVESSEDRHPLAQNLLGVRQAILWMLAWLVLALIGSYFLNPVIIVVLLAGAGLEIIYCLLLKVTYLRALVSGLVKTSGPIAAILALDPNPPASLLLVLFTWLFFWEIGGQNIPSDWNYTEEDRRANAKTVPIRFGFRTTGLIILVALVLTVGMSAVVPLISRAPLGLLYVAGSLAVGYSLLLRPAIALFQSNAGALASRLFDRASYYPLAQLALISAFLLAEQLRGG